MLAPVIIADDHPLFRAALTAAVKAAAPDREIIEVHSLTSLREKLGDISPGLLCLDLHMGDSDGFAGMIALRHDFPALPIAVVSGSESPEVIRRAMGFGASAFVPKSSELEQISAAITAVLEGEVWLPADIDLEAEDEAARQMEEKIASLTPAQLKVLTGVHEGLLNKQIAYNMGISEATVKAHMTAIFRKLDVQTRTQAVLAAASLFIEQPETKDGV
jgi:DNA-binding NarL/FixJ family response regulator